VVVPGVRYDGRKGGSFEPEVQSLLRWTQSSPRTGGVLYAAGSIRHKSPSLQRTVAMAML